MAKYKVLERSFIGHRIVEAGDLVDHEFTDGGTHGPNLELVDGEARAPKPKVTRLKAKVVPPATGAKQTDKADTQPDTSEISESGEADDLV